MLSAVGGRRGGCFSSAMWRGFANPRPVGVGFAAWCGVGAASGKFGLVLKRRNSNSGPSGGEFVLLVVGGRRGVFFGLAMWRGFANPRPVGVGFAFGGCEFGFVLTGFFGHA